MLEGGHYNVADRLDKSAGLGTHYLVEDTEMSLHQTKCREIAYSLVQPGRPRRSVKRKVRLVIFSR